MACAICKKDGHDRRKCPVMEEGKAAEVELQLSERRFILEAIDSTAALLQVPMVTAGVWFMMSRSNSTLGVLNKAILTAELTPIIGDIKFPEGVLLGAAIESTEDFVNLLYDQGLIDSYDKLKESAVLSGGFLADIMLAVPGAGLKLDCDGLNKVVWREHLKATGKKEGPEGVINDPASTATGRFVAAIDFAFALKQMKKDGCSRPTHPYYSPPEQWDAL